MKILLALIGLISFKSYSQNITFDANGKAEIEIKFLGKSCNELFQSVQTLLSKERGFDFGIYKVNADSSFTVSGRFYNALGRDSYPTRKPDVLTLYDMKIKVLKEGLKFYFNHNTFKVNNNEYFIDFSKFINEEEKVLVYPGEKKVFIAQFEGLVRSFTQYINTNTIRLYSGFYYRAAYENPLLFKFDKDGTASLVIDKPEMSADALYTSLKSFLSKVNNANFNDEKMEVTIKSFINDVFY